MTALPATQLPALVHGEIVVVLGANRIAAEAIGAAKLHGATVIAVGRPDQLERLRELGAVAATGPSPGLFGCADLIINAVGTPRIMAEEWLKLGGTYIGPVVRECRGGSLS